MVSAAELALYYNGTLFPHCQNVYTMLSNHPNQRHFLTQCNTSFQWPCSSRAHNVWFGEVEDRLLFFSIARERNLIRSQAHENALLLWSSNGSMVMSRSSQNVFFA
eukprot:scpid113127/ scgid14309/ 